MTCSPAFEHVSYLRSQGVGIVDAMRAIGEPVPSGCGWDDVVEAYERAHELLTSPERRSAA